MPERPGGPVRALVADADPIARRSVADALRAGGVVVVAQAPDDAQAIELCAYYRPDVALLAIGGRTSEVPHACRAVAEVAPSTRIVLLSSRAVGREVTLAAVRAGAAGVLHKRADPASLPRAARAVADGEACFERAAVADLVDVLRELHVQGAGLRPVRSPLSTSEWEVVDALGRGGSVGGVAQELALTPRALARRLRSMQAKLGADDLESLLALAWRTTGTLPGEACLLDER